MLSILEIHPFLYMQFWFMYFNYCLVFHCTNIARCINPFSYWWIFWCFQFFAFTNIAALNILIRISWCNIFSRAVFFFFLLSTFLFWNNFGYGKLAKIVQSSRIMFTQSPLISYNYSTIITTTPPAINIGKIVLTNLQIL